VTPNPFRASMSTTIELPTRQAIEAVVYDTSGRRIRTLLHDSYSGLVRIAWDGTDDRGRRVASGLYLLKVRAGSPGPCTKLLLLK